MEWWLEPGWLAWRLGTNLWQFRKLTCTGKFWSLCNQKSKTVWMGENEPGHMSGLGHNFHWTLVQMEQGTGYFIERPVVSAFLMVELGDFKVTMTKRLVPISERKTHWCSQSYCAVQEKLLEKDIRISLWDPTVVSWFQCTEIGQAMRIHFHQNCEQLSDAWKRSRAEQCSQVQRNLSTRVWLHDIEPIEVPREDVENGNDEQEEPLEAEAPRARMKSQEPHLSRETRTLRFWMLSTEVGVLLVSKVVESGDNIELNCSMKRNENERLLPLSAVSWHKNMQTRFQSRFVETWSNGSDMLWAERSHSMFHFMSCRFHQRSWFSQNLFDMWRWTEHEITSRCSDPSLCRCGNDSTGPRNSAEQNTSVRIADDCLLRSWLFGFAAKSCHAQNENR